MDLTPYEEDDDTTLHKKLVAAKMARKRAEEDLKLLCNRIGLLKQEEGKVSVVVLISAGGTQDRGDQETCHWHLHTEKAQLRKQPVEIVAWPTANARAGNEDLTKLPTQRGFKKQNWNDEITVKQQNTVGSQGDQIREAVQSLEMRGKPPLRRAEGLKS
jgi:hypothetical protein